MKISKNDGGRGLSLGHFHSVVKEVNQVLYGEPDRTKRFYAQQNPAHCMHFSNESADAQQRMAIMIQQEWWEWDLGAVWKEV